MITTSKIIQYVNDTLKSNHLNGFDSEVGVNNMSDNPIKKSDTQQT